MLEKEPYVSFLKKFSKLNNITNEKIHIRIASENKKNGFVDGFSLDYIYTKHFDLDFQFAMLVDEENKQKFCVYHTISYKFEEDDYRNMMMETIEDIQKRNGYYYISAAIQGCEVSCSVNYKNVVTIGFCLYCSKEDAKEVCLQLISQDIALFTRSF